MVKPGFNGVNPYSNSGVKSNICVSLCVYSLRAFLCDKSGDSYYIALVNRYLWEMLQSTECWGSPKTLQYKEITHEPPFFKNSQMTA